MSEENNTQPSTTTPTTPTPSPNPPGLINMNNIFKNLLESMTHPPSNDFKNCNTKKCCDEEEEDNEDNNDEEEDSEEEEEQDDLFEADTDFRWKTLGELIESHNKLSQAYLKLLNTRE